MAVHEHEQANEGAVDIGDFAQVNVDIDLQAGDFFKTTTHAEQIVFTPGTMGLDAMPMVVTKKRNP